MTDTEKEFYLQLGQISVEFARLENVIREIAYCLINSDEDFVNLVLIEDNTLHVNLKLLVKLSRIRHEEEKIEQLKKMVDDLRIKRNSFIHGDWSVFTEKSGEMIFICTQHKVQFFKGSYGSGYGAQDRSFETYAAIDIQNELTSIRACIESAKKILVDLEG